MKCTKCGLILLLTLMLSVCILGFHFAVAETEEPYPAGDTEPSVSSDPSNVVFEALNTGKINDADNLINDEASSAKDKTELETDDDQSEEMLIPTQDASEQEKWVRPMQAKLLLGINTNASIPFEASENTLADFSFRSEDTSIAGVDSNGKISAYAGGETRIIATNTEGISGALRVTVLPPPSQIIPKDERITLNVGESQGFFFDTLPEQSYSEYSYSGSNALIAKVGTNGWISGMAPGTATITVHAALGGATASIVVEVLPIREDKRPLNMAHRGASGYYPENTITAFVHAQDYASDTIELDVRMTKDGKIVCVHNPSIIINGKKRNISDLTLSQIQASYADIPEFSKAMESIRDETSLTVMVEIKQERIEEKVVQIVNDSGMRDRVAYGSFSQNSINKVRSLSDEAMTVFIVSNADVLASMVANPAKYAYDIFSVQMKLLTEKIVRDFHLAGKKVVGWTADDAASISRLRKMGIDCITTDYPDLIK